MADEFIVESAGTERLFVKTYHDFLDSELLNGKEKLVFILLKRYLNFKFDIDGISGKVHPNLETLSKQAGMTKKTVADIIKKLEKKGVISIRQQGLNQPNVYSIRDFSGIWKAKNEEEAKAAIDIQKERLTLEEWAERGFFLVNEKEPMSAPTKATDIDPRANSIYANDFSVKEDASQAKETYPIEWIRDYFEYDIMIHDHKDLTDNINTVMNILQDALNTPTGQTIRVGGQDKPAGTVIARLLKLDRWVILYTIDKYRKQSSTIQNHRAYLLTMLYRGKDQMDLEITNQI